MTNAIENRELTDGMPRDGRGFWQPENGTKAVNPWLVWSSAGRRTKVVVQLCSTRERTMRSPYLLVSILSCTCCTYTEYAAGR